MNPPSEEKILKKIKEILISECEVDAQDIHLNSHLQNELGMDSLALLSLAVALENHYQLNLSENPDQPPERIFEIIQLVQTQVKKKEQAAT